MMCGAELTNLPSGVQRVAVFLQQAGHPHMPHMLQDAARTAQQALQLYTSATVVEVTL